MAVNINIKLYEAYYVLAYEVLCAATVPVRYSSYRVDARVTPLCFDVSTLHRSQFWWCVVVVVVVNVLMIWCGSWWWCMVVAVHAL